MSFIPKVSIIIPVYNGSDFLPQAIDSALSQTYKNIEIIVVNDGSNDRGATKKIAKSYGNKIRYFYKKNGGVASALNLGIKKMNGQYFSWLSHDDVYYPNKVQAQIDFLKKLKNKNVVLYSDFDLIDNTSKVFRSVRINSSAPEKFQFALIISSPVSGCTTLVPKTIFDKIGLFKENLMTIQDYDMWFRIAEKYDFIHIPKVLIKSRRHPDQGINKMSTLCSKEGNTFYTRIVSQLTPSKILKISNQKLGKFYLACTFGLYKKGYKKSSLLAFRMFLGLREKSY
ncbi:glycosyl transferase [Candidatus Berkelbacteria bacterium CG10_big_fil_rev_8_21_14_0_10_41_12]|uniref:Glycosyl transferase n=1 Tax=Candidatus Berkelbacteria bacterium CG10_big_fil_rev_8_21_14_0_10_41_12 TaxID=1974513 RepID=A0A2M6WXC2_9BACT|nr:MAG: glycosyl transferase [Candidatus Berkelbacteria bacterium CG10_big_fil_rev_8_21_14_0_10_41_12]